MATHSHRDQINVTNGDRSMASSVPISRVPTDANSASFIEISFCCTFRRRTRRQSRREESQYETRVRVDDNNCSYPALLCQEKPCGAHVCEYTHVWNMHPSSLSCTEVPYSTYERPPKQKPDILSANKDKNRQNNSAAVEKINMTNFTVQDTKLKEPPPGFYDLDTTELSMGSSIQRVHGGATLPRNVNCPRVHMEPPIEPL